MAGPRLHVCQNIEKHQSSNYPRLHPIFSLPLMRSGMTAFSTLPKVLHATYPLSL